MRTTLIPAIAIALFVAALSAQTPAETANQPATRDELARTQQALEALYQGINGIARLQDQHNLSTDALLKKNVQILEGLVSILKDEDKRISNLEKKKTEMESELIHLHRTVEIDEALSVVFAIFLAILMAAQAGPYIYRFLNQKPVEQPPANTNA
jgi:uncharacterized protein (UPF0210 family)